MNIRKLLETDGKSVHIGFDSHVTVPQTRRTSAWADVDNC